jgi:excisionase family DNA binding protein
MPFDKATAGPSEDAQPYTTIEVARLLGLAVRSVQLMVDRGELDAWKTPGGHRRISRASVERWLAANQHETAETASRFDRTEVESQGDKREEQRARARVLLIEDSAHFQNLITLLMRQQFPDAELHVADDGFAGLAMVGSLKPHVLIIDILLPGIDGATLITSLRSHPQFSECKLIVITSLDEDAREPYAFALEGVPLIHKPRLVAELPPLLSAYLHADGEVGAGQLAGSPA